MTLKQAEHIMQDFGKFMELTNGRLISLFMHSIPESLLPYTKEDIVTALDLMSDHFHENAEEGAVEEIKKVKTFLMFYENDNKAIDNLIEKYENKNSPYRKSFTDLSKKAQQEQMDYVNVTVKSADYEL
jgi:hypothetical protein